MTTQQKAAKPQPIREDPAGFKSAERVNARILLGIVDDFEELVLRAIKQRDPRALADPMQEMATFSLRVVKDVEKAIDDYAAENAARKMAQNSYDHGIKWASTSMRKQGITDDPKTDAKPLYLPPEQRMIDIFKERDLSEIKGLTSDVSRRLSRTLAEGYTKGETINQLTRRVKDATDFSRNKAITIARTETLRAGNAAAVERYASRGIEQLEYVAALDDRVCEECESLHGNIYDVGDQPDLPIHPNCRCTYVAYIEA